MKLFPRVISALAVAAVWLSGFAAETNPSAVSALLNRIGGTGAAEKFVTVVDADIATSNGGKETFVITSSDGKPCIKGSTLSALTTGIGWYLNHYANVNLTWNCPKTDLSAATLPLPGADETHSTDAIYRYYLNYCTFSYSMSTWTWDRWQEEIDWMALRGVNMPLQIIGLEEVWRKFLMEDYGYSASEVNDFVAGPCFMAWFGMNNLQGWGGPNPDWWYERQAKLGKQINERMRALGIEPVLPGFYQLPSNFQTKTGVGAVGSGSWQGFTRPALPLPSDSRFAEVAANYYKRLKEVLGESKYYSMDPFHEGGSSSIDAPSLYAKLYEAMNTAVPDSKWVIQYWQWNGQQWKSTGNVPVGKLIVLDLFSDGQPHWGDFGNHDVVFSTIFNFGGRTGYFGRFNAVIDGYWAAKNGKSTVKGIGASPEAIEQTPVAYDLLYELPWYSEKPNAEKWMADYTVRRYGQENEEVKEAWNLIRNSSLNRQGNGQGPHEAVICSRPALTVNKVSSSGFAEIYYDTNDEATAAFKLLNAELSGENYSFDLADHVRQAMADYSKSLLEGLKQANDDGDTELFNQRRDAFLQLILDMDELLRTNTEFMLGHWTQRARDMANEVASTTDADRDWLELNNARTIITTWGDSGPAGSLRDYSYRSWAGLLKDFYYQRWKIWFDNGMKVPSGGWFQWEWNWAHSNPGIYSATPVGDTHEVASRVLPKYLSEFTPRIAGAARYYVPRMLTTDRKGKLYDVTQRDANYTPDITVAGTEISEIAIDFSKNTLFEESEIVKGGVFHIPSDAPVGERTVRLTLADGTVLTYTLQIIEEITEDRTVSVATSNATQGTVSIDGTDALSVTNKEIVVLRANADIKYDFDHWEDANGENVGNDNPMNYYSKNPASFTAYFVENKWGVPEWAGSEQDRTDMANQYLKSLGVTQNSESKVFYTSETLPESHFHYVPTRIKAAPGGEFTFNYVGAGALQYLYLTAYADLDADGVFNINSAELLGTIGTRKDQNQAVNNGQFRVLLPFDTPEGTTHIRLRFDSAWWDQNNTNGYWNADRNAFLPDIPTNRLIYEILLEINKGVDYVSTVTVQSENTDLGTVRSENATNLYNPGEDVILSAFPNPGCRFVKWVDQYGRTLPEEWTIDNVAKFTAYDNAQITAVFERLPIEVDGWTLGCDVDADGRTYINEVLVEGEPKLDLSAAHSETAGAIDYILPEVFAGNTTLAEIVLPDRKMLKSGEPLTEAFSIVGDGTQNKITNVDANEASARIKFDKPFKMVIEGTTNGSTFNEWGSALLANGTDGTASDYKNGWSQYYLNKAGILVIKWDGATENKFSDVTITDSFKIITEYLGGNQTRFTVTNSAGKSQTKVLTNTTNPMKPIWRFATCLPKGINLTRVQFMEPDVEILPGDCFRGCTSLTNIRVSADSEYAVEKNGVVYDAAGTACIAYPEGRLFAAPFSLTADGKALSAAPVSTDGTLSNLGVSASASVTNPINGLWILGADGRISHANSALALAANPANLANEAGKYDYNVVYGTAEPALTFKTAAGTYLGAAESAPALADAATEFAFADCLQFDAPAAVPAVVTFPVGVSVPADVMVYGVESVSNNGAVLFRIAEGETVPAGQALLVMEGTEAFPVASVATQATAADNLLRGTTVDLVLSTPYYLLDGENFVRHASGTVPANSAYIADQVLTAETFPVEAPAVEPLVVDGWTLRRMVDSEGRYYLTDVIEEGSADLDLSLAHCNDALYLDYIQPEVFAGNTNLASITLPDIQLAVPGERVYGPYDVTGAGTQNAVVNLTNNKESSLFRFAEPCVITIDGYSNGNAFNDYGSCLFANGDNGLANNYNNGWFQFYLKKEGYLNVKWDANSAVSFKNVTIVGHFRLKIEYLGDKQTRITVSNDKGQTESKILPNTSALQPVWRFCTALPVGINLTQVMFSKADNAQSVGEMFRGCTGLTNIHVGANSNYAVEKDGVAYLKANPAQCIAYPEGRLFTAPLALTTADGTHVAAAPMNSYGTMTNTEVSVATASNPLNALWLLGNDRLTHANSGLHLNAPAKQIAAENGTFAYRMAYGDAEPAINFSQADNAHLTHADGFLALAEEAHPFAFTLTTEIAAPEASVSAPAVISFPVDVTVPSGATVYGVEGVETTGAVLFEVGEGETIPAGSAVLLVSGGIKFPVSTMSTYASLDQNILQGTTVNRQGGGEYYYLLEGKNFVRKAGGVIPANSAYIMDDGYDRESFPYDASGTVGIDEIGSDTAAPELYDLMGRRVKSNPRPGIYVTKGKKIAL